MKIIILIFFFFVSAFLCYKYLKLSNLHTNDVQVLGGELLVTNVAGISGVVTLTSSETPTASPTLAPTLTPTTKLSPTPTPIPQPEFTGEQINGFIDRFAGQYGIDHNVLRAIAVCESGFNPKAVNGNYFGLFQFNSITWQNNRRFMGEDLDVSLRLNAEESTQTAAYLLSMGRGYLWPHCNP